MKNYVLIMLSLFTFSVFSQELTEFQVESIMSEYKQFLKDEGYSPSFSESGELSFKYEGSIYTIERPIYQQDFAMYAALKNSDGCTHGALSAVNAANGGSATSQIWLSKSCKYVFIQYTSFIESSTNFNLLFKDALGSVKFGRTLVKEKYKEYNPK